MFIGEYRHTLDDKGRIAIPVAFRASLAQGAILTRGLDRSLFLYPKEAWEVMAVRIAALPLSQADTRAFARFMLAGAMNVDLDRVGRVMVSEHLREFAGLRKDVVFTGLHDRIELWDSDVWQAYVSQTAEKVTDIAERLGSSI